MRWLIALAIGLTAAAAAAAPLSFWHTVHGYGRGGVTSVPDSPSGGCVLPFELPCDLE